MLDMLTTASGTTYTYRYDDQGFRRSKTVNGVTTQYVYNGDKLTYQTDDTTSLYFHYDGDNNITGFRYTKGSTEAEYYYIKNLQGDIIGILDGSGKVVVSYAYDTWGVCEMSGSLASTIGQINPIRYRGYYYDTESGLYYLMSRYYDAEVGRFINADDTDYLDVSGTVLGGNLFAYCENNAVNYFDPYGTYFKLSVEKATKIIDALLTLVAVAFVYFASAKAIKFVSRFSRKIRKKYEGHLKKVAYVVADKIDDIVYKLQGKSVGKRRITIGALIIADYIERNIDWSLAKLIANLLDKYDHGIKGTIYYR